MRSYIIYLMDELDFDKEAQDSLLSDLDKIEQSAEAKKEFYDCVKMYESDINADYNTILKNAEIAGEKVGVHKYSAGLLVFMCMSKHLKECYIEQGIDLQIWHDSMLDLKWKLWECKAVKNIWGSFVAGWFGGFFNLTRFALGRLQFELVTAEGRIPTNPCTLNGLVLQYMANPALYDNMDYQIYQASSCEYEELRVQDEPALIWLIQFAALRYYDLGANKGGSRWGRLRREKQSEV